MKPLFFALLLLTGCLSRPALVRQNYALSSPQPVNSAAPKTQSVLAIRTVEISPIYDYRSFVYRTGANAYELDPYAGFLTTPSRTLAVPVRDYLRNSGVFKAVADPGSQLGADTYLEVHAAEMYGDFRSTNQPTAVLSMRLLFFDSGKPGQPYLQKDYSRRIPIHRKSAAALVAGWNQALSEIMTDVTSDLNAAKHGPF